MVDGAVTAPNLRQPSNLTAGMPNLRQHSQFRGNLIATGHNQEGEAWLVVWRSDYFRQAFFQEGEALESVYSVPRSAATRGLLAKD